MVLGGIATKSHFHKVSVWASIQANRFYSVCFKEISLGSLLAASQHWKEDSWGHIKMSFVLQMVILALLRLPGMGVTSSGEGCVQRHRKISGKSRRNVSRNLRSSHHIHQNVSLSKMQLLSLATPLELRSWGVFQCWSSQKRGEKCHHGERLKFKRDF